MATTTYHHGITSTESSKVTPIMKSINMSVIGIISHSTNADVTHYPLDTPVLLTGITTDDINKAGDDSLLQKCLRDIKDIENVQIVVLRVAEDTEDTALDVLLTSQSRLGVTPKILGAPEMDTPAIVRKMITIAKKTLAFVYASPRKDDGTLITDKSEIQAYRDLYSARELMLIENEWQNRSIIATALGLRAYLDKHHQYSFVKSISNVPIDIVSGIKHPRTWDLTDPDTDVGFLNASDITSVIQHNGFRLWGNHTCSDKPEYMFEPVVRTSQFIRQTINEGSFQFIDQPLNPTTVRDIIRAINAKLTEMVNFGYLIGAKCWYNTELNSETLLMQGKLYLDYDFTPVPVLENLNLNQTITDTYLVNFADLVMMAA